MGKSYNNPNRWAKGRVDGYHHHKYSKKLSPTLFEVKQLSPEQETYQINVTTRQVLSGTYKGNFSTQWIPTNLVIGDFITLGEDDFMVVSRTEEVSLPSINGGITVTCIKVERMTPFVGIQATLNVFFDINYGLKVKFSMHAEGYSEGFHKKAMFEGILTETNVDNDGDELTDYVELFLILTDPKKLDTDNDGLNDYNEDSDGDGLSDGIELSKGTNLLKIDSDGDFWDDLLDFMPTSPIMPNLLIIALIVVPIAIVIWRKKLRHRGREKANEES